MFCFSVVLDKLKVQSQSCNEMFPLSQVAQIKRSDNMFVVDLRDSPEVCQYLLSTFSINMIKIVFVLAILAHICKSSTQEQV